MKNRKNLQLDASEKNLLHFKAIPKHKTRVYSLNKEEHFFCIIFIVISLIIIGYCLFFVLIGNSIGIIFLIVWVSAFISSILVYKYLNNYFDTRHYYITTKRIIRTFKPRKTPHQLKITSLYLKDVDFAIRKEDVLQIFPKSSSTTPFYKGTEMKKKPTPLGQKPINLYLANVKGERVIERILWLLEVKISLKKHPNLKDVYYTI